MPGFEEPTQVTKFLGSTVLSFNATLGLGSAQESSLTVDLVNDCDDEFRPSVGSIGIGAPVVFPDTGPFSFYFGGVLTSWTYNKDSGGMTYKAVVTDPRQLLENLIVIVDSYMGPPTLDTNYVNAYAYWEGSVLGGNCAAFGSSGTLPERGMPLISVLNALSQLNPVLTSSRGYNFTVDWNSLGFLSYIPEYYRIPGPSITALQLIQEGCDALGFEFYVYMNSPNIIKFGYVDLRADPPSIGQTINAYDGIATQLSYGQELRNDKTKTLLFGENMHYMSASNTFSYFFGEEPGADGYPIPIVPYSYSSNNGFWINKSTRDINPSLYRPIGNGPFTISELDIRCAMASFDLWLERVMDASVPGTFNAAIRSTFASYLGNTQARNVIDRLPNTVDNEQAYYAANDIMVAPRANTVQYDNVNQLDLEALHGWLQNLGNTYYGKQFFVGLPQYICAQGSPNFGEFLFTDVPTNAGGWLDYGSSYLGLSDPDLGLFRETDGRLGAFVRFNERGGFVIPPEDNSPPVGNPEWTDYGTGPEDPGEPL